MVRLAEYISAGFPSAAEGYEDEPLNIHDWLIQNPASTFFYRVRGDELREEFVRDGAILIVDRSLSPSLGRLVVTEEQGGFSVRRFTRIDPPAIICGVVVGIVTRF